jgi:two-component sensor histidine kinase
MRFDSMRALSVIMVAIVFAGDYVTPADYDIGVFYITAIVFATRAQSRIWLAGVGITAAVLTMLAGYFGAPPLPGASVWAIWANRVLIVLALLSIWLVLDRIVQFQLREVFLRKEVDHRAKNILAAVNALLHLVPRDDPARFAAMVEERVHAMARIHSLLAEKRWEGADLRLLVQRELVPYIDAADRMRLDGPPVHLQATIAQPLGMVLHELAINAARHGAFSVPEGQISLRWRVNPETSDLLLEWVETRGPAVERLPERRGFGTKLLGGLVKQLDGSMERTWQLTGLHCVIRVPSKSYAAYSP